MLRWTVSSTRQGPCMSSSLLSCRAWHAQSAQRVCVKGGPRRVIRPPDAVVWLCQHSRQAWAQTGGRMNGPTTPKPPGSACPQAPTCFWSWASLGSSEWMSSPTWAPVRRARCLGSSGQPGGSPCGAHGGSGGIEHQAWHQG